MKELKKNFEELEKQVCDKYRKTFPKLFPEIEVKENKVSLDVHVEDSLGYAGVYGKKISDSSDYINVAGGLVTEMSFFRQHIDGIIKKFDELADKDDESETTESVAYLREKIRVAHIVKGGKWLSAYTRNMDVLRLSSVCIDSEDADSILENLELLRRLSKKMKELEDRWDGFSDILCGI